jgi:signal recognition particle receptor subunit beta
LRSEADETGACVDGLILVVDSKDRQRIPEAAEILYDILNDINVLENKTPILVCCNKQDLQFARQAQQIKLEFEREIEEIRKVRIAIQDD